MKLIFPIPPLVSGFVSFTAIYSLTSLIGYGWASLTVLFSLLVIGLLQARTPPMDVSQLIECHLHGVLLTELDDLSELVEARDKVSVYYARLTRINPQTDAVTNLLSVLLDMQDRLSAAINSAQSPS